MRMRTIFQLNCHRLVGAFHQESGRAKSVDELVLDRGAQHKRSAFHGRIAYRTSFILAAFGGLRCYSGE